MGQLERIPPKPARVHSYACCDKFEMEDFEENIKIEPEEEYEEQLTDEEEQAEEYSIDIKNMNLYSLDTTSRKGFRL